MKLGFHEAALENLTQINTNDLTFGTDVIWFTALSHLRAGDSEGCHEIIQRVY